MHSPTAARVLRFGAFEADLQARELRRQGMQIKLQEQPFQALEFLLEHPGEIVTREQTPPAALAGGYFRRCRQQRQCGDQPAA